MKSNKWTIGPAFFAILFMWLVVFEWFGTGLPQIHYLIRVSYILILLQWLIVKLKSHTASFPIPKAFVPLALLLFQQIISVPYSPLPFHGLEVVLGYLILALGILYLLDVLRHNVEPRKLEFALFSMAAVFCLFNLLDILTWFKSWWDISGSILSMPPFGYRLKGVFLHHANIEAAFLNLVVPLIFVRLIYQRKLHQRFLWLMFLAIIVIVEYFTSSRGGWLAAISAVATTSLLLLAPVLKRGKDAGLSMLKDWFSSRLRLLSVLALSIIVVIMGRVFLGQLRSTSHAPIASARTEIWNTAWQIFRESPILGNGAGSMHILPVVVDQLPPGFYLVHAHNVLLQVAAENGVIGVLLLLVAAGFGLAAFFHAWRRTEGRTRINLAAYAGVLVGVGVHNLVDVAFEAPIYILATGVFLALVYQNAS
ncbi:MAG: O-antigen ligase family protein, partial [Anaerolineales bacterium]